MYIFGFIVEFLFHDVVGKAADKLRGSLIKSTLINFISVGAVYAFNDVNRNMISKQFLGLRAD